MILEITHQDYTEAFPCTKAVKDTANNKITLYAGDAVCFTFSSIKDFTIYTLEGGNWTDPDPTPTEQQLRADVDFCLMLLDEDES